ncbi:SGNH/GDSL hydrolase family protein [Qaidamihabitans albus]|uniref:SGNH/GDSL hydrolase family protein n=1 Tax=Qaidamihabitans albus TaxID=2795733 RepID=UPI0018F2135D|nr:SGNH/GDSL hydrolase family protein [Qaidamihabitans albus]
MSTLLLAPGLVHAETPEPLHVVALGDSYGSGTGAGDYQDGTEGSCWRSANSYSELIATRLREGGRQVELTNVSCSGAATADLSRPFKGEPAQLDTLEPGTDVVLLSVGTSDVDFAGYGGRCVQADCAGEPTRTVVERLPEMGRDVAGVLDEIERRSPEAEIVLTGYGRQLTPGANAPDVPLDPICDPSVFTKRERIEGNAVASVLDLTLRRTAWASAEKGIDVRFVSPYTNSFSLEPTFAGHSLCEADMPYYRGFDALAPGQEGQDAVLHLNMSGQAVLADLVQRETPALAG